jgi:hypothetical protein
MRRMQVLVGCVLALTVVVLPAVASAASVTTAAPAKTPVEKKPAAKKAAVTEKVVPPSAPALPSGAESLPATPPLPAIPSAPSPGSPTEPGKTAPQAALTEKAPAASPDHTTPPARPLEPLSPKGGAAPALPPEPATPGPKVFPYTGLITGDTVYIRSGPGQYYYPLLTVNKNASVTVEGEANGWLALKPPKGVAGLMRKSDLTMGQGGTATVSATTARVYATGPTAKRQWCVMTTLKQGDTVKVLAPPEGDMVRIAPPAGTHVYVVDQYVAAGGSASTDKEIAIAKMEIEPPKADPFIEDFKKADVDLEVELAKPVTEQKFDEVTAKYKDIAEKADKTFVKQAAIKRLGYIAGLKEQQAEVMKVISLGEGLDRRLAEIKSQRVAQEAAADREKKAAARADFLATGLVAKMESLEDVDYPIKFKLVDQNNRPIVVLKSSTYDLGKYVGKVVGVRGTKTYLKDWRIYLVTVDDLETLE